MGSRTNIHAIAAIVLVFLISFSIATPAGFTTFFSGPSCPKGWSEIEEVQGRLILSVTDGSQAGVTVGQPLLDQEDRVHSHPYSAVVNVPSKSIAAIDCCNDQGALNGNYDVNNNTDEATSGLPFVQMVLCSITANDTNPIPFGTVGFFEPSVTECPSGWEPYGESNGRFIISGYDAQGVVVSNTPALASGEDRVHEHGLTVEITTTDVEYVGVDGCCNSNTAENGQFSSAVNVSEASSGIPYIQLLTCVAQNPTFNSSLPSGALIFNEVSCPPGWNVTFESSGRFIVPLPANGIPGATFGADSIAPGYNGNLEHSHGFSGSVSLPPTGVGLDSGCCGNGYAASMNYSFQGSSSNNAVNLPYLTVPLCAMS